MLADRFREGRAFLAGDAAHQVTPRGGTGMNTAIRDGRDLGWKLAWRLHGWAGDGCWTHYEPERRPVARHNMERSVDPNGSIRSVAEELHVDIGPRIPHAWVEPGSPRSTCWEKASLCSAARRRTGARRSHRHPWPSTASTRSRPAPLGWARAAPCSCAGRSRGRALARLACIGRAPHRAGAGLTGGPDLRPLARGCLRLSPRRSEARPSRSRRRWRSPSTRSTRYGGRRRRTGGPRRARPQPGRSVPRAAMPTATPVWRKVSFAPAASPLCSAGRAFSARALAVGLKSPVPDARHQEAGEEHRPRRVHLDDQHQRQADPDQHQPEAGDLGRARVRAELRRHARRR